MYVFFNVFNFHTLIDEILFYTFVPHKSLKKKKSLEFQTQTKGIGFLFYLESDALNYIFVTTSGCGRACFQV